jgi:hypothetical protein
MCLPGRMPSGSVLPGNVPFRQRAVVSYQANMHLYETI